MEQESTVNTVGNSYSGNYLVQANTVLIKKLSAYKTFLTTIMQGL